MTKISIIIPFQNVENYITKCLSSVVNQTLEDIEIICINDGSKDESDKIVKEFAQKDLRLPRRYCIITTIGTYQCSKVCDNLYILGRK